MCSPSVRGCTGTWQCSETLLLRGTLTPPSDTSVKNHAAGLDYAASLFPTRGRTLLCQGDEDIFIESAQTEKRRKRSGAQGHPSRRSNKIGFRRIRRFEHGGRLLGLKVPNSPRRRPASWGRPAFPSRCTRREPRDNDKSCRVGPPH